jgi:hypothetical protein
MAAPIKAADARRKTLMAQRTMANLLRRNASTVHPAAASVKNKS